MNNKDYAYLTLESACRMMVRGSAFRSDEIKATFKPILEALDEIDKCLTEKAEIEIKEIATKKSFYEFLKKKQFKMPQMDYCDFVIPFKNLFYQISWSNSGTEYSAQLVKNRRNKILVFVFFYDGHSVKQKKFKLTLEELSEFKQTS